MSEKLFQEIILKMSDPMEGVFGVADRKDGTIVACSDIKRLNTKIDLSFDESNTPMHDTLSTFQIPEEESADNNKNKNRIHFNKKRIPIMPIGDDPQTFTHFAFAEAKDENEAVKNAKILAVTISSIKCYYDEQHDRCNFVKNVVLDNVMQSDIFVKAREFKLGTEVQRVVYVIRTASASELSTYDIISTLFPDRSKDFIFNTNENEIVLVKETKSAKDTQDLECLAKSIIDTLISEFYTKASVGIGSVVTGVRELAKSFREALISLEVGKVFDHEQNIVCYENLGIARLIYQLPNSLCETFLKEVFKRGTVESLDHETLFTIQKFFENNLNVSETSRRLFVHRNTLVYRLEKIKKITGLDLREFDHAIIFKVALMVRKYLSANPTKF